MPLYDYRCTDCGAWDRRVGGLDDQTALCSRCAGIMLRLTEDVFLGYFAPKSRKTEPVQVR